MRKLGFGRLVTAAVIVSSGVAIADPAVAAAFPSNGPWHLENGVAQAQGTVQSHPASNGVGTDYDVAGDITVNRNDGQCYYVRFFIRLDILGFGFNTARQCGTGTLPFARTPTAGLTTRGIEFGLCKVAPGTPEESNITGLGNNCVKL